MSGTNSPEFADSHSSVTSDTSDTPISGPVKGFDFVDDGDLLVEVENADGELWYETYEFITAERPKDLRHDTDETDD